MIMESVSTVAIRIRFAGSQEADTFHMTPQECTRFLSEWKSYLGGSGPGGGEYISEEADHPLRIILNFSHIAYTEPGKVY